MNANKSAKIVLLFIFLFVFFLPPYCVSAQSLSLTSDKSTCRVGDSISVSLNLNTSGKSINVVAGTVNFPKEFFDFQSIKTGSSFLTLWLKRPTASNNGTIDFSGGVPHGFSKRSGNVFSFMLKCKKVGKSLISASNAQIFLNDGLGTKLDGVALAPLKITIVDSKKSAVEQQQSPAIDKTSPLPFAAIISRDSSIAENKYFISFSAIDKETGIDYYQVREEYVLTPFWGACFSTGWQKAETPYILKLQHWWSRIYIRAYDGAGNFTEEIVDKPLDLDEEEFIILNILFITAGLISLLFAIRIYRRFKKSKNE